MYFHVYKNKYPASSGQHILMLLESPESVMNKGINKYIDEVLTLHLSYAVIETVVNFEKVSFQLTSIVTLPKIPRFLLYLFSFKMTQGT